MTSENAPSLQLPYVARADVTLSPADDNELNTMYYWTLYAIWRRREKYGQRKLHLKTIGVYIYSFYIKITVSTKIDRKCVYCSASDWMRHWNITKLPPLSLLLWRSFRSRFDYQQPLFSKVQKKTNNNKKTKRQKAGGSLRAFKDHLKRKKNRG